MDNTENNAGLIAVLTAMRGDDGVFEAMIPYVQGSDDIEVVDSLDTHTMILSDVRLGPELKKIPLYFSSDDDPATAAIALLKWDDLSA